VRTSKLASMTGRYDHLSHDDLIRLLERRDTLQRYGLIWEREGIEPDRALNQDYVVFDLDRGLSTAPQDALGWRNLVIEGDNWDALRALRLTHAGRIRCILIDPPYNTGNRDFAYNDHYVGKDDRFRHSLWLEFLYRRLVLARDVLSDDGVIIVCINDENRARLDMLMEQVFPGMRVGSFVWKTRSGSNDSGEHSLSLDHEHILVYAQPNFEFTGAAKDTRQYRNPDNDRRGPWKTGDLTKAHHWRERINTYYPLQNPATGIWYPCNPTRVWAFGTEQPSPLWKMGFRRKRRGARDSDIAAQQRNRQPTMEEWIRQEKIVWPDPETERVVVWDTKGALLEAIHAGDVPKANRGRTPLLTEDLPDLQFWVGKPVSFGRPWFKRHLSDLRSSTALVSSWIRGVTEISGAAAADVAEVVTQRSGTSEDSVKEILGSQAFNFPKPPSLFREMLRYATDQQDIIMDFFAGSATTAHAVLALNAEDDGDRQFIMVSNTEATAEEPDKNLCRDVCAERIRRVIAGYGHEAGLGGDFAYIRTRLIPEEDVVYDLDHGAVWTLLQLRQGHRLQSFDPNVAVQFSEPESPDVEDATTLVYAPIVTETVVAIVRDLAGAVQVFTPTPGLLRDAIDRPNITIESVPDRLLAEFRRNVVGL
jgi:adenine-specific DNA-methyltransferase